MKTMAQKFQRKGPSPAPLKPQSAAAGAVMNHLAKMKPSAYVSTNQQIFNKFDKNDKEFPIFGSSSVERGPTQKL